DEWFDDLERRVANNRLAARRHPLLRQEVADEVEATVIEDVAGDHRMAMLPKHARDRAPTGRALPNAGRDRLDAQQRLDRDAGRLIQVEAALGVRVPLDLAGMVEHSLRATPPQLCERVLRTRQAEHVAELAAAKLHAVHLRPAFIGDNAGG